MTQRIVGVVVGLVVVGCIVLALTNRASEVRGGERPQPPSDSSDHGHLSKQPFALVELFTSEGCSSCPSADKVLADLDAEARKNGTRVFPLAFQVDYWNNLGWVDPYSSEAFSDRQRQYGDRLRLNSIYTPQMIVNGVTQFVGSDRATADETIKDALQHEAKTGVGVDVHWPKAKDGTPSTDRLVVDYKLADAPAGSVVMIALVERGLVSHVRQGENSGRTLRHDNVVRVMEQRALDAAMTCELKTPLDSKPEMASVVVFVQDPLTMKISGAQIVDLPARPAGSSGK